MLSRTTRVAASAAVALALVLGSAAAPAAALPAADSPDFSPSASSPRKFMINVLGSLLGKAMPDKWRREQLANQYQYNHSWEGFDAAFGYSANHLDVNGEPQAIPKPGTGTYDDYVIAQYEQQIAKGGTNGKPLAVPATAAQKLVKGVGGVATAITGYSLGAAAGNFGLTLFGFDADGAVCTALDGAAEQLVNLLTGTSCDALAFADAYTVNSDIDPNAIVLGLCGVTATTASPTSLTGTAAAASCSAAYVLSSPTPASVPYAAVASTRVQSVVRGADNRYTITYTVSGYTGSGGSRVGSSIYYKCVNGSGVYQTGGGGTNLANTPGTYTAVTTACTAGIAILMTGPKDSRAVQAGGFYFTNLYSMMFRTGQALPPSEVIGTDPERTIQCSITGTDGHVYTASSAPYRESAGAVPEPVCPALPDGVAPANVTLNENSAAGVKELSDMDVSAEYLDWWNAYPECRTGACKLDLIDRRNPAFPVSCFDLGYDCDGWFESATRESDYECHYGIHTVDLEECFVYSGTFNQARILSGAPYSDPMTGTWSGGTNAPSPDTQALSQEIQDPDTFRRCLGMGSATFDPVAFVMRPVQCALEWAFVPRRAVVNLALAQVEVEWSNTVFGEIAPLWEQFASIPVYTGCEGIPVTFTISWPITLLGLSPIAVDWNFGAACTGDMRTTADNVRNLGGALIYVSAVLLIVSYIMSVINYRQIGNR